MPRQKSTHVDDPQALGLRLREVRTQKGLSQRQLSFPGCTPAYLSRIEAGQRIPSLQLLRDLGRRLGVSADYLATGSEEAERDLLLEAELALRMDEIELAEHLLQSEYAEAVEDTRRGRALGGLGELAYREGVVDRAIEQLVEAQALLGEAVLEHPSIAITLSMAYNFRGEHERAIAVYEQLLELAEQRGDPASEARFSVLLANALVDQGNLARAQELLGHAIATGGDSTDSAALARLYWAESRLHVAKRSFELAARYAHLTLAALELSENRYYIARAHHLLAYIELERGNAAEALEILDSAEPLIEQAGDRVELALFRVERARGLLALGRVDEAFNVAAGVLPELEGMRARADTARAYTVVAEVLAQAGRSDEAIELYRSALERMGDSPFALDAYERFADLLEREGRQAEGFDVLRKALALRTRLAGHEA